MRITRVEIEGFGCLQAFQESVAPGLHLFHGPNESGKSTLQKSILALLYGFYESDRARPAENEARETFTPWSRRQYKGRLEYELADGSRYRVERDFSTPDLPTTIWDLTDGKDVTGRFGRGRHGNVPFARRQIGMTKRVFDACAFVSQGELFEVTGEGRASPQEIGDAIISLADTASRDISAQSAIDYLGQVFREKVGGPRAPTKPYLATTRRVERSRGELEEIDAVRAELESDSASADKEETKAGRLRDEVSRTRYLLLQADAREHRARLAQLEELAGEDERLRGEFNTNQGYAGFPSEERDAVLTKWRSIGDLRETLKTKQPEIENARHRLTNLSSEREALGRRQRDLGYLREFPGDRRARIDGLANLWRSARAVADAANKRFQDALVDQEVLELYEQLRTKVGHLSRQDVEQLTRQLRVPAPASNLPRTILRAIGLGLRWVWRHIAALVRWAWNSVTRRPPAELEDQRIEVQRPPLPTSLSPDEVTAILADHSRYQEIATGVRKHLEEKEVAEEASAKAEAAAEPLRSELEGLVEDVSDLEAALREFHERTELHGELQSVEARLLLLGNESSSFQKMIQEFEEDQERLGRLEYGLRDQLQQATGKRTDFENLIAAFEEACRRKGAYEQARGGLRQNEEKRGIILQSKSPGELQENMEKVQDELEVLERSAPQLVGARTGQDKEKLEELLSRQQGALRDSELLANGLRSKINTRLAGLRGRAEVEEDLGRYECELGMLERFGEELKVATEVIELAMTQAHRDFAPSVGRFLGEGLARVTQDRYGRVLIDPSTLRLTTEVPETHRLEDIKRLSRGTRAAAYLLLRVGLAQHMSSLAEPVPLILDDPLVDLDEVREENLLDLLLDLTSEVQILLFSKSARAKVWFERHCNDPSDSMTLLSGPNV